jgi:hypothetical protein
MFREQELWLPGVREEVQEQLRPVPPPGPGPPGPEAALPLLRQTSRQHEAAHQGRSQVSQLGPYTFISVVHMYFVNVLLSTVNGQIPKSSFVDTDPDPIGSGSGIILPDPDPGPNLTFLTRKSVKFLQNFIQNGPNWSLISGIQYIYGIFPQKIFKILLSLA